MEKIIPTDSSNERIKVPKYISITDFEKVVDSITGKIADKMRDTRYGGRRDISPIIVIRTCDKNGTFDRFDMKNIEGFLLEDEAPTVEEINYGCVDYPTIKIVVTFNINHVFFKAPPTLDLPEPSYTFDTYEDYLKFITRKYQELIDTSAEDIEIATNVKGNYISIPSILVNVLVHKLKCLTNHSEKQFTSLKCYSRLTKQAKSDVDRIICPITVNRDNVHVNNYPKYIKVEVVKEEMVKETFRTNYWDDIIVNEMVDALQDIL